MKPSGITSESVQSSDYSMSKKELDSAWGAALTVMVCEPCDWSYLLPANNRESRCPHCFQSTLVPLNEQIEQLPYTRPPELVLPFTLPASTLTQSIQNFSKGIPFSPIDLTSKNLLDRLNRLYLPMWLVDAEVKATWKTEVGFDYQVVSHQDQYNEHRGGWTSREVEEDRIRWEPRLGRLNRSYQNIAAPALEEHHQIKRILSDFDLSTSESYRSEAIQGCLVRLPNRPPQDAWIDAAPVFQAAAAEECRQAANADHIRQFSWQPEYQNQNWTLLLLPIQTTFYLDDENKPQVIYIHGQTGQINGMRRASMKQGRKTALIILVVAVLIFLFSLLVSAASLLLPALLAIGVLGLVIALIVGLGAVIPIATVWWFNRGQSS